MPHTDPETRARVLLESLRTRLAGADRVRIHPAIEAGGSQEAMAIEISDASAVRAWIRALNFERAEAGPQPRAGELELELLKGGTLLARLQLWHGRLVIDVEHEAPAGRLDDPSALAVAQWLAACGVSEPLETLQDAERRAQLWDRVVEDQRALLPTAAPDWLWEPGRDDERMAELERLLPHRLERAVAGLRVLGAAAPEWFVGLPLDRLIEPWLHDRFDVLTVSSALASVAGEPVGLAGAARWLVHARGAGTLEPTDAARILPPVLRWALAHPVARNRTETLELLGEAGGTIPLPLLVEVFEGRLPPRTPTDADAALVNVFGGPETFYLDDAVPRATSDYAYAALLLARRGEKSHRDAIRAHLDDASPGDFHTLVLALEAMGEDVV